MSGIGLGNRLFLMEGVMAGFSGGSDVGRIKEYLSSQLKGVQYLSGIDKVLFSSRSDEARTYEVWYGGWDHPLFADVSSEHGAISARLSSGEVLCSQPITSSGLGRVMDLMQKSSVGFISAFRSYRDLKENLKLTKDLKAVIRSKGFGYIPVIGEWKEDKENVSVERTFAISRSQLTFEELLANLVEIGRENNDFNQQAYMIASGGVGYVIAGEDNSQSAGTVLEKYESLNVSTIESWLGSESGGRTTLAKGPEGRGFAWSCGLLSDVFREMPNFVKPGLLSHLKSAKTRVFGEKRRESIKSSFLSNKIDGLDTVES